MNPKTDNETKTNNFLHLRINIINENSEEVRNLNAKELFEQIN